MQDDIRICTATGLSIRDDDGAFCRSVERLMRSVGMIAISFASAAFLKAARTLLTDVSSSMFECWYGWPN